MSEELKDEVEALNSIYGDGTLVAASDNNGNDAEAADAYILKIPGEGETSSLRLEFPARYPDEPPSVLGTHSSGGQNRPRGAAARDLELFRDALGRVFQPGNVCLFDALEELARLTEELGINDAQPPEADEDGAEEEGNSTAPRKFSAPEDALGPEPPWIMSDVYVEMKSTFIARCAHVTSAAQAESYVGHLLATDKKVRAATHNMTAWRIRGQDGKTSFQDCDDDGETAAGGRLLHLMQLMDLWDVMVVVTRWYGGQKLGPRRFAVINQVARDSFVKAGLVPEASGKKKGPGK
ncbi:hypothetical protein PpBr36_03129 [Pyricularia pennisetigena]|uniref:hypothetical protein n=1 Tax=Pyricularia pennisetigena TaxID=1578925 RepID=UPI001154DEB6|nr:hypothetical protein PpBr36_03129 [Pyricularia pennisetigena]TLS30576.1 hypothetical protein PpBr36_03129 [Pyricularia pennisetigena]